MNKGLWSAIAISATLLASPAAAQTAPGTQAVILTPEQAARWDTTVHVGWFGSNKSDISSDWNRWYDSASFDAGAGYYLTSHLKIEANAATTVKAGMSIPESVALPGDPFPIYYRSREHRFRATTMSGAFVYQFSENSWFHPFMGAGLGVERENEQANFQLGQTFLRDRQMPVVLPDLPALDVTTTSVHPFVTLGFKAYASERLFFRMDVRTAASSDRIETLLWRAGFGVDF